MKTRKNDKSFVAGGSQESLGGGGRDQLEARITIILVETRKSEAKV